MYSEAGGVVAGATSVGAGVVLLPDTAGSNVLTSVALAAIVLGGAAIVSQMAAIVVRNRLK